MANKTDYARQQDRKPRKKLVLPPILPWEYGSNKFASQKGSGGFGAMRNATISVTSSRELSESSDGIVPRLACPPLWDKELGSQSGLAPFGGIREQALKVQDKEAQTKTDIHKLAQKESEGFLKIWSQPNPDAKISKPFGKRRNEVSESVGGRRFSPQELQASRAAIPRFQDPRTTIAAKAAKDQKKDSAGSLVIPEPFAHLAIQQSRVYSQQSASVGLPNGNFYRNGNEENELTPEQYMAWLGGQLTLQSKMAVPFQRRNRSYASYYDRLMSERTPTKREIREKLKKLQLEQEKAKESDESSSSEDRSESLRRQFTDEEAHSSNDENQNLNRNYKTLKIISEEDASSEEKGKENGDVRNCVSGQTNVIAAAE